MSFGAAWNEVQFTNDVSTFIYGQNHDTGGNNACGKTSILNAIVYAVYNKPFDNISLPRLINSTNAAKNTLMEVIYTFSKDNATYEIHRKRGESHGVTLLKDGIDITPDSVNETDTLIEQIYGFSYDMFTSTIVFSGSSVPFLDRPVSQQRNLIEELFNISILSEKAVKLKKLIQQTESDIKVEEAILKEKESSVKMHQKRLHEMEQRLITWEQNNEKDKLTIKSKLEKIEGIDFENEQLLFTQKIDISNQIQTLKNKIESDKKAISQIDNERIKLTTQLSHLQSNNCPYCLQLMPNASDKIKQIQDDIRSLEFIFKEEYENNNHQQLLDGLLMQLDDVNSKIRYDNLQELLETKSNSDVLISKLTEIEAAINPFLETYEALESEAIITPDYSKLDNLKSRLEHQHFLLKLLTDKNSFIRRRIISKTIPFLNLQLNTYAKRLGLPHIVKFHDDMSCTVSEFGRELDFGNLSAGEKKRVNLSMSLAFRDVLHHLHAKVNLLFVDEIDASLCPIGVENVINVLKEKTKEDKLSTWIVMHRSEAQGRFDRDLIVHKNNGFSQLEFKEN